MGKRCNVPSLEFKSGATFSPDLLILHPVFPCTSLLIGLSSLDSSLLDYRLQVYLEGSKTKTHQFSSLLAAITMCRTTQGAEAVARRQLTRPSARAGSTAGFGCCGAFFSANKELGYLFRGAVL